MIHFSDDPMAQAWGEYYRPGMSEDTAKAFQAGYEAALAAQEYEYGWAGDERASVFYETREAAEEYMGNPRKFRRRKAGPWEREED